MDKNRICRCINWVTGLGLCVSYLIFLFRPQGAFAARLLFMDAVLGCVNLASWLYVYQGRCHEKGKWVQKTAELVIHVLFYVLLYVMIFHSILSGSAFVENAMFLLLVPLTPGSAAWDFGSRRTEEAK